MLYKTITLELLKEEFPNLHEKLRAERGLLKALDRYSTALKESHAFKQEELSRLRPGSQPEQIASEAAEIAIEDLRARLSAEQSRG